LLTSARGARNNLSKRETPRSQALALQGSRKGEEEQTDRHTVKAHVGENRTGSRITNAEREGMERARREGMLGG